MTLAEVRAPRVSIGVPVYNGERYLAEALESLLAQSYRDIEVVVCDNASTDRTGEIALAYAARDPRVRHHRNPSNIGSARNYARALELARGEYFRWAAADDLAGPESVERCVEVLDRDPSVVLAYPRTVLIDGDGAAIRPYDDNLHLSSHDPVERFAWVAHNIGLCNAIYGLMRTASLRRTGLLGTYIGSDVVLHAELSLHGRFHEVPERLFFRRMHESASSSMTDAERQQFYDPARRRRHAFREWRHLVEHLRAALRAPLTLRQRLRLVALLARGARMGRDKLAAEVTTAVRQLAHRPLR